MNVVKREPVAIGASIVGVVNAVLVLLVAFGVELSPEQTAAVMGVANAVVVTATAIWTRARVSPVEK